MHQSQMTIELLLVPAGVLAQETLDDLDVWIVIVPNVSEKLSWVACFDVATVALVLSFDFRFWQVAIVVGLLAGVHVGHAGN